ncbi:MAG: hypothetical protein WA210_23945 [Burkholderiaceae bacterium]
MRRYKVLLVPGYFGSLHPSYFADQLQWLDSIGVDHEKVAVHAGHSSTVNAPIIAAAIRDSKRPVILITHSKGSVDAMEALRAAPSLRDKVKAWVSLQGAFLGSPVADMLLDGTLLDPLVTTAILSIIGGSKEAALGLTTQLSRAYYEKNLVAINDVLRAVPTLGFASTVDGTARIRTLLEIPREMMWRRGIRSDGLVPTEAAVLPGMNFVKVSGVDHIAPVMHAMQSHDRVRMTKALLVLTLPVMVQGLPRNADCRDGG